MYETDHQAYLSTLLQADPNRMAVLRAVEQLPIDTAFVAAGFLRNLVWDNLHGFDTPTPLNDVDVIYFQPNYHSTHRDNRLLNQLTQSMPPIRWQIKNQASMHIRNGDRPYTDVIDAMRFWPEKETAIGVRLRKGRLTFISGFGFDSLFRLQLTWNPNRDQSIFERRIAEKHWLSRWPKLTVIKAQCAFDKAR